MMRRSSPRKWLAYAVLTTSLFACNIPRAGSPPPQPLSGEALRQTLAAPLPSATPDAAAPEGGAPSGEAPSDPQLPAAAQPPLGGAYQYRARSGDTLAALAERFGVSPEQIATPADMPRQGLLPPGADLTIPNVLDHVTPEGLLLPDSELVYSPSVADFDLAGYISQAGGYLSSYREVVHGEEISGAAILKRVADDGSVNPRLLLALLEYQSGWVRGQPYDAQALTNPLRLYVSGRSGLYNELLVAATQLNLAYYGWRQGNFVEIRYRRETPARLNPTLNAGSVALAHFFAMLHREDAWLEALYGAGGFPALYVEMFGDPWRRAAAVEPLFPPGLVQPLLELPFLPGQRWSLTAGPHPSWNAGTPRGALDFSPVTGEAVCAVSRLWVTASAPGVIARSGNNAIALDLDGDGYEGTGWVIFYYHLAEQDLQPAGLHVDVDAPLGHPSCEGGRATGKHVHLARKYNGEWLAADGPLPFVLSGWTALADERNYYGSLVNGDQIVGTSPGGARTSIIVR